jgi:hypothetical protein
MSAAGVRLLASLVLAALAITLLLLVARKIR